MEDVSSTCYKPVMLLSLHRSIHELLQKPGFKLFLKQHLLHRALCVRTGERESGWGTYVISTKMVIVIMVDPYPHHDDYNYPSKTPSLETQHW